MRRILHTLVLFAVLFATGELVFADFNAAQFAQNFNGSSGLNITLTSSGTSVQS